MTRSIDIVQSEVEPINTVDVRSRRSSVVEASAIHVSMPDPKARPPGATIDVVVDRVGPTTDVLFNGSATDLSVIDPEVDSPIEVRPKEAQSVEVRTPSRRNPNLRNAIEGLAAFIVVSAPIFVLSIVLGRGASEVHAPTTSSLAWIRVVLLSIAGIVLVTIDQRRNPGHPLALRLSSPAMIASLAAGTLSGMAIAPSLIRAPIAAAAALGVLRAVSEAAFFRVFLGRKLDRAFSRSVWPILTATLLHAVYRLTESSAWAECHSLEGAARFAGLVLATSLPYAILQQVTKSASAPLVAQTTASVATMIASAY
jgi:hypothetical protein